MTDELVTLGGEQAMIDRPKVTYEWRFPEQMPVEQMESGRRLTVAPTRIEIHVDRERQSGLSVYLYGQRINRDGSRGGNKGVSFHEGNAWHGQDIARLPAWAERYLEAARQSELAIA